MKNQAIRFSFFEITWIVISFLLIAIFFMLQQFRETPPYLVLSESESVYRFELGSYELSPEYLYALSAKVIPVIANLSELHECNILQVFGHTDGIGMRSNISNLDQTIMSYIHNSTEEMIPSSGSNIDLGMLRAIAVARYLESQAHRLPEIEHFLAYSAGPIIDLDGSVRKVTEPFEDRDSRRVELRLTKSAEQSLDHK